MRLSFHYKINEVYKTKIIIVGNLNTTPSDFNRSRRQIIKQFNKTNYKEI